MYALNWGQLAQQLRQFDVKCWQLLPYDGYEWGLARRFQVGDTVRVSSSASLEYRKKGKVCKVSNLGVEVRDHRTQAIVGRFLGTHSQR